MAATARPVAPWLRYVPFLVLIGFLAAALLYRENLDARAEVGAPAPNFTLETLEGEQVSLAAFAGRPVIINFWTTWCPECKDEMPALEAFHRRWGDEIVLLGVNMRETPGLVRPFVAEHQATYPILLDRFERVSRLYRVTGVPETWLIDRNGIAVARYIGPLTHQHLEQAAELLLADEKPGQEAISGGGRW